jgi:lipid-binding SYLF domain-containing protein
MVVCLSLLLLASGSRATGEKAKGADTKETTASEKSTPEAKDKNAEKRAQIDAMAKETMDRLLESSESARKVQAKAFGHAVFSNLKVAFGVSGGGGSGVASSSKGEKVYMKMGTAGLGLGLGGQKYKIVFFFEDEKAFRSFVDKGWQADASAQAAAAKAGANAASTFSDGVAFFQLTDKGLIASADISGTKYWKNEGLNKVK